MKNIHVFAVHAGRSGGKQTTDFFNRNVDGCLAIDELRVPYSQINIESPSNSNAKLGYGATKVSQEDVDLFEKFLRRIPLDIRKCVEYFDTYDLTQSIG
jgi:hypothetical protein